MTQTRVVRFYRLYRFVMKLTSRQAAHAALAICRALEEGRV
jgi:hypothetical protein